VKQNIQNKTYVTIKIHKHNNKNTKFTILNRSIQKILPYMNMCIYIYIYIYIYTLIKLEPKQYEKI
jgi:hypothetical protein